MWRSSASFAFGPKGKRAHGSLECRLSQLGMPLNCALRTPDAGAIVARLVSQEHDDLLARRAAERPFRARVCDPPAHWKAPNCAKTCEFFTGFVREIGRFSRIRRESRRDFLQASAQSPVNKPYFSGVFGDPGRIRTCNLPLRRELFIICISFLFQRFRLFLFLGLYRFCTKMLSERGLVGLRMGINAQR